MQHPLFKINHSSRHLYDDYLELFSARANIVGQLLPFSGLFSIILVAPALGYDVLGISEGTNLEWLEGVIHCQCGLFSSRKCLSPWKFLSPTE